MCDTCGCSQPADAVTFKKPGEEPNHHHDHPHSHDHHHDHDHHHNRTIDVELDVLSKNNLVAERNRGYFDAKNILALNLVSSPGSGKTTLLEKTVSKLKDSVTMAVIEGDQQTLRDAERIQATGIPVIQVNTGTGCHLDADMIHRAIHELTLEDNSILWIENVGNLVCPALFDLGEAMKVAIISVTEGDDKPLKYPTMFMESQICVINKTDLLPYVDFDVEACKNAAKQVNPTIEFFELSAKTEDGLNDWLEWIQHQVAK
ncbi:MAG: hydrogenase nickel incorporation protein HypB [Simkaniaceae bacterium]|nr:hydrogenase nickel incorporation protein HypB [Simkaniaceae bacterium]